MTTTDTNVTLIEQPTKPAKARAKRKTFKEVRAAERAAVIEGQRAYYEPLMAELADEINKLREELDAERAVLAEVRGSLFTAIKFYSKGHV